MKKIDWYIVKKFLGTYVFTIILIIAIVVAIDYNEKMDKFAAHEAPWQAICFQYYLNYIPYCANLFSPLFVFIAVIFFTSKLAGDSEIIAMLASGISFNRLLKPYLISATIIAAFTFYLNSYVIPRANITRIEFTNKYVKDKEVKVQNNSQLMVEPGVVAYFYHYDKLKQTGTRFALERFENKKLVSRLTADRAIYQGDYKWHIVNYKIRHIDDKGETLESGAECDSTITIAPEDIIISKKDFEKMNTPQLYTYIQQQRFRGVGNIKDFEIEYHKRWAAIATSFIMTLMGVSLSSRKIKGGMGIYIGIGLTLSFVYILFQTVSSTFAVNGYMSVMLAVWLPNIVFAIIGYFLYLKAPR